MIRTVESSELMLTQYTLAECRRAFEAKGHAGWADFCRAQERTLIKEGQLSVEIIGYVGQAARKCRELGI